MRAQQQNDALPITLLYNNVTDLNTDFKQINNDVSAMKWGALTLRLQNETRSENNAKLDAKLRDELCPDISAFYKETVAMSVNDTLSVRALAPSVLRSITP